MRLNLQKMSPNVAYTVTALIYPPPGKLPLMFAGHGGIGGDVVTLYSNGSIASVKHFPLLGYQGVDLINPEVGLTWSLKAKEKGFIGVINASMLISKETLDPSDTES